LGYVPIELIRSGRFAAGPDFELYVRIRIATRLDSQNAIAQAEDWFSRGGVMAQKTVLLVEDDLEIRDILQDLLEAEGYDVIPASHGKQALEFLAAAPAEDLPQLVVLDMMMPLVDGSQVLASMKSDPKLSPIPVVVLSAVARERPAGAAAFLRKPIPLQKFFDTVRGFVEAGLPRFAS
jgi:CheY-like chemotaxis protein